MESPYYDKNQYHMPNTLASSSRQIPGSSSPSPIGDWLAKEEALLDGMESELCELIPPILSIQNNNNVDQRYTICSIPENAVIPRKPGKQTANNRNGNNSAVNGLRSTSEIPKPFDSIFKFGLFNIIQSQCLADTFYQNNNLVISAPTGSGKTVFMELAIIRALIHSGSNSKVIYMAPTKSLCNERARDWQLKFKPLGIECKEFTGDTQRSSISAIQKSTIIITTPEKWDSMTRRWNDHKQLMKLINLFLIDEVHILNEKRGACLEACVSRMQTMDINLRYIAVSATVPNLEDIATWLNAKPISYSEEYRPIKLERFVYAYQQKEGNMFLFDRKLDWKLLEMIEKHSDNKPVLIFCSTRKSAEQACFTITKLMDKKGISTLNETAVSSQNNPRFRDKNLIKFVGRGIAFHHAGLDPNDRSQVENKFMNKEIRVIATTSTLAVGVNLPAHLVIVKSTQGYQNGNLDEYTDIDLLQMMGRAGRPGLDTSGCVVILTTSKMKLRYESLVSGTTNLESRLHENLIEHLVSEICLGTITNEATALKWLQSTFLYVRLLKNPVYYKLDQGSISSSTILQEICSKDLELLQYHNLIQKSSDSKLKPTAFGFAMDIYYIRFPTMVRLMESKTPESVKDTLDLISKSHEEMDTFRFNQGDKQFLNSIKNHDNIRFPVDRISNLSDKVFIMIQCLLGDISLNNSNGGTTLLAIEGSNIMKHSSRIARCLIDCSVQEKNAAKLRYALEIYQCLQAHMWSDSPYIARQLPGIGSQYAKTIAQANLINFDQLRNCDPGRFEQLLHRNPPFGIKLCKEISILPDLSLEMHQMTINESATNPETGNVIVSMHLGINLRNKDVVTRSKQGKGCYIQFWMGTSENHLVDFRRTLVSNLLKQKYEFDVKVEIESSGSIIHAHLQCGDYVGLDIQKEFKPKLDPRKFISIAGPSNISKPQKKQSKRIEIQEDFMDIDDVFEMQEIFQMPNSPVQRSALTPAPVLAPKSASKSALTPEPAANIEEIDIEMGTNIEETDDNIDPQAYNTLFADYNNRETGPSTSFESTKYKKTQEKGKKKPKKKTHSPPEPCKHRCKHKDKCRHKCCKLFLHVTNDNDTVGPITGTKRPSPENIKDTPSKERKLGSTSNPTTNSDFNPATSSQQPQRDLFDYFPQLSEKEVELLGSLDKTFSENKPTTDVAMIDQSIVDDIDNDSMANNDEFGYNVDADRPIDTLNCDELWDEVGRIAHEAFSTLSKQGIGGEVSGSDSIDVTQSPEEKSDEKSLESFTIENELPTLNDWIKDHVIIVYN